ncbi:hypothetical protein NDA18_005977 [Ustilago nuda]|nr:hypothetical protein NDA18_005977 [Ustilago nuda]
MDHEPELETEEPNIQDPSPHVVATQPTNAIEEITREANTTTMNLNPTLREALDSDEAQQWHKAIRKELEGLEAMGTWEIVDVPPETKLVDSKIVLHLKLDADGIPVRHKARLIERGFTQ